MMTALGQTLDFAQVQVDIEPPRTQHISTTVRQAHSFTLNRFDLTAVVTIIEPVTHVFLATTH